MKVIFLGISGVLQSDRIQRRFKHDLDRVKAEKICTNPDFSTIDKYDLGAVIFDWHSRAIKLLSKLSQVERFAIVAGMDWGFSKLFPQNFVQTYGSFTQQDYDKSLAILEAIPEVDRKASAESGTAEGGGERAGSAALSPLTSPV